MTDSTSINATAPSQIPRLRRVSARAVRTLVALLLLTAAGLKVYEAVWMDPAPASWLTIGQVTLETTLGVWLISGLLPRLGYAVAILCFTIFAIVNLILGELGRETCGCFGPIQVHPWLSLLIDLAAMFLLVLTWPRGQLWWSDRRSPGLAIALGITVIVLAPAVFFMLQDDRQPYHPDQHDQTVVYAEPLEWLGKSMPILPAIDKGQQLKRGTWELLFYKDDCPDCRQKLQEILKATPPQRRDRRMLVEIPPYVMASRQGDLQRVGWQYAQLTDQRQWFFPAPTSLVLQDGRVVKVNDQEASRVTGQQEVAEAPHAQPIDSHSGGVVFTQPAPHDLGYVKPGESRNITATIHNPFQHDLVIRRVESECVCTQILQRPDKLPAGQSIELPMRFDALQEPQVYAKDVALFTTDPRVPVIRLTIQARIGLPLRVESPSPEVTGREGEYLVVIHNDGEVPVRLLYSAGASTGAFAKVPRDPVPPHGKVDLPIIVATAVEPALTEDTYIQVRTDSLEQPVLSVRIARK